MDLNKNILCTITEVEIIDESIPIDNESIMSIINNMDFDGVEQPLFVDKLSTTN